MAKTITEKYVNNELVERVTIENAHQDTPTLPQDISPWWGITPPPRYGENVRTITTDHVIIEN